MMGGGAAGAGGSGAAGANPYANIGGMFGQMPAADTRPPAEKYATQLT